MATDYSKMNERRDHQRHTKSNPELVERLSELLKPSDEFTEAVKQECIRIVRESNKLHLTSSESKELDVWLVSNNYQSEFTKKGIDGTISGAFAMLLNNKLHQVSEEAFLGVNDQDE